MDRFNMSASSSSATRPSFRQMAANSKSADETRAPESTEHLNSVVSSLRSQLDSERSRSKKLELDLEAETMKNQGMQMLFDCMQEERAENRHLKGLLKRRKLQLRKLKKRLQSSSGSVQVSWDDLSDASELDECPSKDSRNLELRPENGEGKENLTGMGAVNGAAIRPLVQTEQLSKKLEELRVENEQLSQQLASSDNDKDAEILRLRRQVNGLEKSRQVSGTLCDTLSDEAVTLKRHLADTVAMCQKLMRTLEMKDQDKLLMPTNRLPSDKQPSETNRVSESGTVTLSASRQQCVSLELKLKEVVTMNSRWQQYNEQREQYVQTLLQRNLELEQALVNRGQQLSQTQQEHIDQILMQQKQKLEMTTEEKTALSNENRQLRQRLDELRLAASKSETLLQMLSKKVTSDALDHSKAIAAHTEVTEALKVQLQMYKEDFGTERRDRERAQAQITQLEAQIRSASQQLSLSRAHASPEPQFNVGPRSFIRQQSGPQEASLVGRGFRMQPRRTSPTDSEARVDPDDLDLRPTE